MNKHTPEKQEENRDGHGRFVAGVSGNPDGRPKGLSITQAVKERLEEVREGEERTNLKLLVEQVVNKAISGDRHMLKLVWSYMDGAPRHVSEAKIGLSTISLTDILSHSQ